LTRYKFGRDRSPLGYPLQRCSRRWMRLGGARLGLSRGARCHGTDTRRSQRLRSPPGFSLGGVEVFREAIAGLPKLRQEQLRDPLGHGMRPPSGRPDRDRRGALPRGWEDPRRLRRPARPPLGTRPGARGDGHSAPRMVSRFPAGELAEQLPSGYTNRVSANIWFSR